MRKLWRAIAGKSRQMNSFKIRGMCKDGGITNRNLSFGDVDSIFRKVRRDSYSRGRKMPGMREFFDLVTLLVAQSSHGMLQVRRTPLKAKVGVAGSGSQYARHHQHRNVSKKVMVAKRRLSDATARSNKE